jgi:hypothetical protein
MSGFFDVTGPPEPPRRWRQTMWWERPADEVGEPVPPDVELVRTSAVAARVRNLARYTNGFSFVLALRSTAAAPSLDPFHHSRHRHGAAPRDEVFRFGVAFADGRKATSFDSRFGIHDDPPAIVLLSAGGRGGVDGWDQHYWVAPLPPPGPVAFVCEWPAAGIQLTRAEVDAAAFTPGS